MARRHVTTAWRFHSRIRFDGPIPLIRGVHGPCHEWTGSTNPKGYGTISVNGRTTRVHRLAIRLADGQPVPAGLDVDHRCRNRRCVRRSHLRAVTHRENILASTNHVAARAAVRACPAGHPYDDANTYRAPNGTRKCRTCRREQANARRAAAREHLAPITTLTIPTPERQAA